MKHLSIFVLLALFSAPAMAYVGPGLGLGVIGTIFGVLAAIVLALFGLFWYPIKRALSKKKTGAENSQLADTVVESKQTDQPSSVSTTPEDFAKHSSNELNEASDATNTQSANQQVRTESEAR